MHAMNKKQSDTRKEERCSDSLLLNKVEDEKPKGRYGHSHVVETAQHDITDKYKQQQREMVKTFSG